MGAVQTQQLAEISDLDTGPADSAMVRAVAMYSDAQKDTYLRRASGVVLAAYAKRFQRTAGSSFTLATWGDFTIALTVAVARWMMIFDRGVNPNNAGDKAIHARYEWAEKLLDEIADLENTNARIDPDAVGSPDGDDFGPLASFEGGDRNEADHWAQRASILWELA